MGISDFVQLHSAIFSTSKQRYQTDERLSKMTSVLAQRFTIIGLTLTVFAVSFVSMVHEQQILRRPYLSGELFVCVSGNEPICNIQDVNGLEK